jgi:uncharacterized protein
VTTAQFVAVAAVVCFAALVQVVSGFGFALLAVPLMSIAVPTSTAVVVSTLLGAGVSTWQAWQGRAQTVRPIAGRLVLGSYIGMPLGLLVFLTVSDDVLRLILGVAVLIAVVLLAARIDLRRAGSGLDVGAGFVSGVLNTSLSTNGPPLVFVLQARHLEPDPFRSTINTVFAASNLVGVPLFLIAGQVTGSAALAALVALPALIAGQFAGYPLRRHLHGERFRRLVLGLLVIAALSAITRSLV